MWAWCWERVISRFATGSGYGRRLAARVLHRIVWNRAAAPVGGVGGMAYVARNTRQVRRERSVWMIQRGIVVFLLFGVPGLPLSASEAVPRVLIESGGGVSQPVVVAADSPPRVRAAAEVLAEYLARIGKAEVPVVEGSGATGLAVGRAADFPELATGLVFDADDPLRREEYLLRSHAEGVWLIGASELAVEHAVWDFLYRLGYRQFFPGEIWEVVPELTELQVAWDAVESPAFHARRIWYGYGPLPSRVAGYRQWLARNRVAQGFRLHSSHYYEAILAANREAFDENPEFFALVDGQRRTTGNDLKFCISNPELRQLVVEHACRVMQAEPERDSISMDPSDGGNWCECPPCQEMGGISNRVLTLANEVADAINRLESGTRYVGMYAYNEHSPPPSIRVHPRVIVSATAGFLRGGFTLEEIIDGWQAQGAVMGVYDYFSVLPWDWDLPGRARASRPSYLADSLPDFYARNVRFHDAESSDNWGPNGLGYYVASRILWDLDEAERVPEIVDDFLTRAFGPAREPLAEFYRLIDGDNHPLLSPSLVGRMYRSLAEGRQRAAEDPAVRRRIDELISYTRYVEWKLRDEQGAALRHAHRIRDGGMVHFRGMWPWRQSQGLDWETIPDAWQDESGYTADETLEILENGIRDHPVAQFTPVTFSQNLVPATPLNLPEVPTGNLGDIYQRHGRQGGCELYTWFAQPGELPLKVTGGLIAHYRDRGNVHLQLFADGSPTDAAVDSDRSIPPDGQERRVVLRSSQQGLHRLELRDGGDASRLVWQDDWPMVLSCTPGSPPPVRGAWTLYFYVPRGTEVVAGFVDHASGQLRDADGNEVLSLAQVDAPGYFTIPVPEGQDGRLWQVERSRAQLRLLTVPPYLARNHRELLLPREVVQADRP